MPANISYNKELEKYCFMGVGSAWHGLGQIVTEAQTWEQAMELAGLNWTVSKKQLSLDGELVPAWGVVRDDNSAFLGQVGNDYTTIQNRDVFAFMDALLEVESGAHYLTAGALGRGERVFALAKVPNDFAIKGTDDLHKTYLCGITAHDGSMSKKLFLTDVRVVCENTVNMALSSDGKSALTVRHTRNAQSKLDEAKRLIKVTAVTAKRLQEKLDVLAERAMTKGSLMSAIERIFAKEAKEEREQTDSLELTKRSETVALKVLELFESNDNNAFPQIRGTGYNLFNAFTQYTDHERSVQMTQGRKEAQMTTTVVRQDTALFGSGNAFKTRVLDTLLSVTEGNPTRDLSKTYSVPTESVAASQTSESNTTLEESLDDMFPAVIGDD